MALATQDAVVLELMTMGQESAAYLGELLRASSPHQELAAEILRCCGRVIAAVSRTSGASKKRKAVVQQLQHEDVATAVAGSPATTPPRKRSRGAEALGVVTSGTTVDGFIWRKYGQKEINGRKHPRLYYRCAYRDQQAGCPATRRVQRTHEEDEPPAYEIAYYGEHTCMGAAAACQGKAAPPPPAVVDFGSNSNAAWPSALGAAAPGPAQEHQLLLSWDGDMSSQGGWSSEAGFEAQTTHEWLDTSPVEEPSAAPCYAPDPMTEFLDGSFDWASALEDDNFGFGALHHIATLQ